MKSLNHIIFAKADIGTIVNVVLCDIYPYIQGQTFSYDAFAIKKCTGSGCPPPISIESQGSRREVALVTFAMDCRLSEIRTA